MTAAVAPAGPEGTANGTGTSALVAPLVGVPVAVGVAPAAIGIPIGEAGVIGILGVGVTVMIGEALDGMLGVAGTGFAAAATTEAPVVVVVIDALAPALVGMVAEARLVAMSGMERDGVRARMVSPAVPSILNWTPPLQGMSLARR